MSNLKADMELADKFLEVALKYNELKEFLTGDLTYELKVKDPNGNSVFSAMHIMEAIYNKHRKNPELGLDKKTYDCMVYVLDNRRNSREILAIFSDIEYQMNSQKNGTAAFNVDCLELLNKMKSNIDRNKLRYQISEEKEHPNGIWPEIEMHNITLEQITGHKIL